MVLPIPPNTIGSDPSDISNNGNVNNPAVGFEAGTRRRTNISNSPQERSQVQQDGAYIYSHFLLNEFQQRNLPDPTMYIPAGTSYHSQHLSNALAQLRIVSEEFAQTPMRQWVQAQAANVPLEQLDFQAFSQLLYGLFQEGGVTWERIVVLFYFCTDLAARAVRESVPQRFQYIVEWSFLFFSGDRMIQWVLDNGGWMGVLQGLHDSASHAYQLAKVGVLVLGVVALGVYLWKSQ